MKEPTPGPIDENPISSFNLNIKGNNPDIELPRAKEAGLTPAEELVAGDKLKHELVNPVLIENPDTGQKFEVLYLNRNAEGDPIIMAQAWSVDSHHKGTLREAEQVALQTGRPMYVVNNPNTSKSDKLTKQQHVELEDGPGFKAVSVPILGALKAQGIDRADFEGTSMGARLAASMTANAKEIGIEVNSLIIVDSPGMKDRTRRELLGDFAKEAPNMQRYNEIINSHKIALGNEIEQEETIIDMLKYYASLAKHGFRTNFIGYTDAMRRPDLPQDIAKALETQPNLKLTLIFGTKSNISNPEKVIEMYQTLFDDETKKRIRLRILPGDTHALGAGNRISWHISDSLKRSGR